MPQADRFESALAASWPPPAWSDVTVLVAVSGGADSVALLRAMLAIRPSAAAGRIVVAHFNHRLRGAESDADQAFVVELCGHLQVDCEVGAASAVASPGSISEETARDQRYQFLEATAKRTGARFLATAHTADDQAETILHRIIRGTGIAGLAGIPRHRVLTTGIVLLRPLLALRRAETLSYLTRLGQPFRNDSSNRSLTFTRNRIRHELLTLLKSHYNPQVVDAVVRLGSLAADAQTTIQQYVNELLAESVTAQGDRNVVIDCESLRGAGEFLVRELFIAVWRQQSWPLDSMSFEKWQQLQKLAQLESEATSISLPGSVQAERKAGELFLSRATNERSL